MESRPASAALHSFFDGAPFQMGISELTPDRDMLLVSVNPAAAVLGLTPEQVQGKRISELGLAGPGKGVWLEQYLQALETRKPVNFEQPSGVPGTDSWWEVTLMYGVDPATHVPSVEDFFCAAAPGRTLARVLADPACAGRQATFHA